MISFINNNSNAFLSAFTKYGINTPLRIAHFLGQTAEETGSFKVFSENLNYRPAVLLEKFNKKNIRITPAQAYKFGNIPGKQKANPEMIANYIYGGEYGRKNLGNIAFGDGWKYRGRGILQLTGRKAYEEYSKYSGRDLVNNPDLASDPEISIDIAGWFWTVLKKVNSSADKNDIKAVTKLVNGGNINIDKRIEYTNKAANLNISIDSLKKKQSTQLNLLPIIAISGILSGAMAYYILQKMRKKQTQ